MAKQARASNSVRAHKKCTEGKARAEKKSNQHTVIVKCLVVEEGIDKGGGGNLRFIDKTGSRYPESNKNVLLSIWEHLSVYSGQSKSVPV